MEQDVRLWVYALACFSFIELILIAVAYNARQKMKLTAESAIMRNTELSEQVKQFNVCCGCGEPLSMKNWNVADGCPCNSPRGINHGLVPTLTCTCDKCDPEKTGSTRDARLLIAEISELKKDANGRVGRDAKGRFEKVKN